MCLGDLRTQFLALGALPLREGGGAKHSPPGHTWKIMRQIMKHHDFQRSPGIILEDIGSLQSIPSDSQTSPEASLIDCTNIVFHDVAYVLKSGPIFQGFPSSYRPGVITI